MNYNEKCTRFSWLPDYPGPQPWCEVYHQPQCEGCTIAKYTTELEDAKCLLTEMLVDFSECCEGYGEYPLLHYGKRLKDLGVEIAPDLIEDLAEHVQCEYKIYQQQCMHWGEEHSAHYLEDAARAEEVLNYVKM